MENKLPNSEEEPEQEQKIPFHSSIEEEFQQKLRRNGIRQPVQVKIKLRLSSPMHISFQPGQRIEKTNSNPLKSLEDDLNGIHAEFEIFEGLGYAVANLTYEQIYMLASKPYVHMIYDDSPLM